MPENTYASAGYGSYQSASYYYGANDLSGEWGSVSFDAEIPGIDYSMNFGAFDVYNSVYSYASGSGAPTDNNWMTDLDDSHKENNDGWTDYNSGDEMLSYTGIEGLDFLLEMDVGDD